MKHPTLAPLATWLLAPWLLVAPLAAQAEPAPKPEAKPESTKPQTPPEDGTKKPTQVRVGDTIPGDVTLTDVDGKSFDFESARGKPVALHFWSISCPYEKVAEPKLHALQKELGDKVVVLAVNANQNEIGDKPAAEAFAAKDEAAKPYANLRKHAKAVEFNHRILLDHGGELARLLDGKTTPHCFVFDAKGVLRYQGALDDDPQGKKGDEATNYVRGAVDALLAGKPVEKDSTRPYG